MGASTLNIAVTGLNAAQAGLLTTSHNISNASTEGFSRQRIQQTTQNPQYTGSGFLGQGTRISTVQRLYNSFLADQVTTSQASTSQLESYLNQLGLIDNMLGDKTVGLSPAITGFFEGINAVASAPSSIPSRQSMLASAQTLVSRFQDLSARLQEIYSGTNSQITTEVGVINSLAQQVAEVNQRIALAEAAGPTQQANDLRDQRDLLIVDLNKHIRTDVIVQSDGSFSVFFGNGQPLVAGESVFTLTATAATNDSTRLVVGLTSPTGVSSRVPEQLVSGGALGGLLEFRRDSLDQAQNTLGRIALGLASSFNTQHKLGQDLTGAAGLDFFNMPEPVIISDVRNGVAAVSPGALTASITDVGALTTSDYLLSYDANGYTLRRLEDDQVMFAGTNLPMTVDGITFNMAGTPAVGASFKVQPTCFAARDISVAITDPRSIAAGLPVASSAGLTNTGTVQVSGGSLKTPVELTYSTFTSGFTGFPAGTVIDLWDPATATSSSVTVSSSGESVNIPVGSHVTVNGISFTLSAAPDNGDTFTVGPNQLSTGELNTGGVTIAAAGHMRSTFTYDLGTNSLSLTPLPTPLLNTTVSITNAGVTTDYPIRLGNETIPYIAGATYSYNGTTFTFGGAAPVNGDTFTIGAGYTAAPATPSTTSGTATLTQSATSISASLPTSNYTLSYDNANNLLTGFPPGTSVAVTVNGVTSYVDIDSPNQGVSYTTGMSIMVNGVEVSFNGVPADGDTFSIGPSTANTTDSRNILALASLQTKKILLGGTASFESSYAQLVSGIGNTMRQIDATYEAQSALLQQAVDAVQSFSGVNLDEEAANLLRYQQAYQASAKIIDISGRLFDLLASLGS